MTTNQLKSKKTQLLPVSFLFKITIIFFVFVANIEVAFSQPSITSFTPSSGPVGTVVTISGSNFSTTAADNIVFFGAVKAAVANATTSTLTVTVPAGATFSPISVTTNNLTDYSSLPFDVIFSDPGNDLSSASFASPITFPTISSFNGVSLGDFDGDGKPDVICGSGGFSGNGGVKVFLNTSSSGNISFNSSWDFTVGGRAWDFAIGDLDGDGKIDIASLDFDTKKISILRNTSVPGTISFDHVSDLTIGSDYVNVIIADLNSDGKPDIFSTNTTDETVSVFKNITSGSGISFDTVTYVQGGLTTADYNNDGKIDLAKSGYYLSDYVWVYKNTGTGGAFSFDTSKDLLTPGAPNDLTSLDLNGDGLIDIVSTSAPNNSVSIFKNISSGGDIAFAAKADFPTSPSPVIIRPCDLNGDGKPDVIIQNPGGDTVITVMQNTSSGSTLSLSAPIDYRTASTTGAGFALGDLDGDGKPEIIVSNFGAASFSVLQNLTATTLALSSINLTAIASNNQVQLNWKVSSDLNISQYVIQRSLDGTNFSDIGSVKNAMGNNYSFSDRNPVAGTNYYRIKVLEANGKLSFSSIQKVTFTSAEVKLKAYPNPAKTFVVLTHPVSATTSTIFITDFYGHVISKINVDANTSQNRVDLTGVASGNYIIVWSDGTKKQTTNITVQ